VREREGGDSPALVGFGFARSHGLKQCESAPARDHVRGCEGNLLEEIGAQFPMRAEDSGRKSNLPARVLARVRARSPQLAPFGIAR